MKNGIYFTLYFVLILEINSNFLRFLDSDSNTFDYSTIKAIVTNQNIIRTNYTSTNSDQSVAYITGSNIIINATYLNKTGASNNLNNSVLYGVNSAVLINRGHAIVDASNVTTFSEGSNGITITNKGSMQISRTIVNTTSSFSRGILSTYGGSINGTNVSVATFGRSSYCLSNDKGEGSIICEYCRLMTLGVGSPIIYSKDGDIKISYIYGTSNRSQIAVLEGDSSLSITGNTFIRANGNGEMNDDSCGVLIYQSKKGGSDSDRSSFNCETSELSILTYSSVYSTAPFFFVTNTKTSITLNGCSFIYGSGTFLKASQNSHWGTLGENGADVILNLVNQNIEGDFVVDSNSELTINMKNSTIKGKINSNREADELKIVLDSYSHIELTGNSYYTSISNEDKTGSNINNGSYSLSYYDDSVSPIRDNALILNNNLYKIFILLFLMILF